MFIKNLLYIILAFLLAIWPTIFWLAFYYKYSKKWTTPRKKLLKIFGLGLLIAFPVGVTEVMIFKLFPQKFLFLLSQPAIISSLAISDILLVFAVMFFLIAPLEEGIKFLVLKTVVYPSSSLDQIIDGVKFGVVLGLGFALIENAYYFYQAMPITNYFQFGLFFGLRFLIATLAHSLYGGIMGYYLALAKFHKTYAREFLTKGFITVVLIHGVFNFAFFLQQTFFAIALISISLVVVMKWYQDRIHFQSKRGRQFLGSFPPFLSERHEIESVLFKNNVTYNIIKKLNFCPFCLKKRKEKEEFCHYCGQRLP